MLTRSSTNSYYPSCVTWIYENDVSNAQGYSILGCGKVEKIYPIDTTPVIVVNTSSTVASSQSTPSTDSPTRHISTTSSSTKVSSAGTSTSYISSPTPPPVSSPDSSTNVRAVVGGVLGGIAGVALIGVAAFLVLRRRGRHRQASSTPTPGGPPRPATPRYQAEGGSPPPPHMRQELAGYPLPSGAGAASNRASFARSWQFPVGSPGLPSHRVSRPATSPAGSAPSSPSPPGPTHSSPPHNQRHSYHMGRHPLRSHAVELSPSRPDGELPELG